MPGLSCFLALALAADPPAADRTAELRALLRRLDAAELTARDAAEAALVEMGPEILEQLPEEGPRMSAETKLRLGRVRQRLWQARAVAFAQGSRITLQAAERPVIEVLDEIARQTGNTFHDLRDQFGQDDAPIPVSVEFTDAPFWPAVDQLLDQAGLSIYDFHGERDLGLVLRNRSERPRSSGPIYLGAFRLVPRRIEAHRDLSGDEPGRLVLRVGISWEPRLAPIGLRMPLDSLTINGDDGQPVALTSDDAQIEAIITPQSTATELEISMRAPPRSVAGLRQVRGKLAAIIPGGMETFAFENLGQTRGARIRRAGATVLFEGARKNNALWEVRLIVSFDEPGTALESHRGWVFDNEAFLAAADGSRVEHEGLQTTLQTESEVGVAYLFDIPAALDGYRFVYKTPAVMLEVPLDFELGPIPLP